MTTPGLAKRLADIQDGAGHPIAGVTEALRDLANQVERLEAQRKQLRDALSMVRDYVVTMKGSGHDYQVTIDDALKATE